MPEENRDQPSIENVIPPIHIPPPVNNTDPKKGEEANQHDDPEKLIVTSPPFHERLTIPKLIVYPNFDLVGELKILCIKIPPPLGHSRHPHLCRNNQRIVCKEACEEGNLTHYPCSRNVI